MVEWEREARRAHETPRPSRVLDELVLHLGRDQRSVDADDAVVRQGNDDRRPVPHRIPVLVLLAVMGHFLVRRASDERVVLIPEPDESRRPLRRAARPAQHAPGGNPR